MNKQRLCPSCLSPWIKAEHRAPDSLWVCTRCSNRFSDPVDLNSPEHLRALARLIKGEHNGNAEL